MAADRDDQAPRDLVRPPGADRPPPDRVSAGPRSREQQVAEHVRYREVVRARVEVEAARDAWVQAVPGLRAEWTAHTERYPSAERQEARTQPDGSWTGDGGRRLSPGQNAEAGQCAADLREEAHQRIRPAMERIEAADRDRKLAGLEHMCKGEDRLKEKIADELAGKPGQDVRSAISKIADAIRFTLVYPPEGYAEGVLSDVGRLKAEGFELIKLKNLWDADQYKGINSQWRVTATGARVEMQFHTSQSREAKELTHEAYERIRAAEVLPAEERDFVEEQALESFQRRANALLVTPPGTDAIEDFPRKEQRGG